MELCRRGAALACVAAVLVGCDGAGAAPSAAPAFADSYTSAHFVFEYTTLDAANIATIATAVESQYVRIVLIAGNGAAVLRLSPADFHRDWFAFVRERYGL